MIREKRTERGITLNDMKYSIVELGALRKSTSAMDDVGFQPAAFWLQD